MVDILHVPFGQEHPYEQLPEERFPRQPLACQPFTVGIVTRPPGTASQVHVHQVLNGETLPVIEAALIPDWQPKQEEGVGAEFLERIVRMEQDVWQASLTAPAVGSTLTYWIETDDARTDTFTLRGEDWQLGGGLAWDGTTMMVTASGETVHIPSNIPSPVEMAWLTDGQHVRRVRLAFACRADEQFFGLGERFNALDQRGNVLDIRCYEQYKNQGKRTYMPIPFLLSSEGYGIYVQSSRWMQFDLTALDRWVLEADVGPDETLKIVWFHGDDPVGIIGQFARMTGPAPLPPLWAFGLWMSANEWNNQERVIEEVKRSFTEAIRPSVVVIEAWSDETTFYIWNDALYQPKPGAENHRYADFTFPAEGKWPDPKGMVDWLHQHDLKLVLWQIPALKVLEAPHPQHEADHGYFEQSGFGVHEPDGTLYKIRPFWFRNGYLWDVTNPAARDWWLSKRAYLLDDLGIDGFKTDGGEHLWSTQVQFADGRRGDEVWNEYPQLYTAAYYDFANQHRQAVTFSRAGFTGSQRSPLHWAGDENSTWEAFRHSILAGLSAGISGVPFWGWDIGGFSGPIPSAELYLRGAAMAAFCPVMQYHSEYNSQRATKRDRTPWNIQDGTGDARVIPVFRYFVHVRHNLMPYIWQEARHSASTGEPMMRALKLYDRNASDYQYFFGRDLLVCPVVEEGVKTWPVYLPEGGWRDLWTGESYSGGQTHTMEAPVERIPVFVRAGARIPVCFGAGHHLGEPVNLTGEENGFLFA